MSKSWKSVAFGALALVSLGVGAQAGEGIRIRAGDPSFEHAGFYDDCSRRRSSAPRIGTTAAQSGTGGAGAMIIAGTPSAGTTRFSPGFTVALLRLPNRRHPPCQCVGCPRRAAREDMRLTNRRVTQLETSKNLIALGSIS